MVEQSETGRPRARRRGLTIRDIAELAGVSSKSVSIVVNGLPGVGADTRERIQAIIAEHGYVPRAQAQGLATGQAFLVGHVFNNPNPEYLIMMQQGLLEGLDGSGYALVTFPLDRSHPQFTERLRAFVERHRLDGVVFSSSVSEDERLRPLLDDLCTPYVRVAARAVDTPERSIAGHDRSAAALAAAHLDDLGHEHIAFVSGPPTFLSSRERREGFEDTWTQAGHRLDPDLTVEGDYTFESGVAAGQSLLARHTPPTGVFCSNDEMAVGVLHVAQRLGVCVPRDLTIVGFDNYSISTHVHPSLTTVNLPTREMGRLAALKLLEGYRETGKGGAIADPGDTTSGSASGAATPRLMVRETSAPPAPR